MTEDFRPRSYLFTTLEILKDFYRDWDGVAEVIWDIEERLGVKHSGRIT